MTFFAKIKHVKDMLREEQRLSLRALRRELEADDAELDDIVDELVTVQRVARHEDGVLIWQAPAANPDGPNDSSPPAIAGYTPRHLAERILASRSAMEGEKKQATVLFCDVVDSVRLSQALGTEPWHAAMNNLFQLLTSAVHRFEGTVNQYTGDGIMALFGAPVATENHAELACMAALRIRSDVMAMARQFECEHGLGLHIRIGINSGEVVVGKIGDDLRMDYTARGQVVGLAARLEQLAPNDEIFISAFTAQQVDGRFDWDALLPAQVKGLDKPMAIYQLRAARRGHSKFDTPRKSGLTPLVGREADLARLDASLQPADENAGRICSVVGDAGTGKSRLCHEYLKGMRRRGMRVLKCYAMSHGRHLPYAPVKQTLRTLAGISDNEEPARARARIKAALPGLDELALRLMHDFLDVPDADHPLPRMDADAKRRQLFDALTGLVTSSTDKGGSIVVFVEDVHWLDLASQSLLEHWVRALPRHRILLLVNYRPDIHPTWHDSPCHVRLELEPLDFKATCALLEARECSGDYLPTLSRLIFERTGGNPFFCEELLNSLIECGALDYSKPGYRLVRPVEDIQLPASVHALLAARIDRLSEDAKLCLQYAAVIGRHFSHKLLASVMKLSDARLNPLLDQLAQGSFLLRDDRQRAGSFLFKHALVQDVSYQSMLVDSRQRIHAAVARALELEPHEGQEALIAHHWKQAGEKLDAAKWYCLSADRQFGTDVASGVRHAQTVLTLTQGAEGSIDAANYRLQASIALLIRAWRQGMDRAAIDRLADEARELAQRHGNADTVAILEAGYGVSLGIGQGDVVAWGEIVDGLHAIRERISPELRHALLGSGLAYCLFARGQLDRAIAEVRQARRALNDDLTSGMQVMGFSTVGQLLSAEPLFLSHRGRLGESLEKTRQYLPLLEAEALFEEWIYLVSAEIEALYLAGAADGMPGVQAALQRLDKAIQQAEHRGSNFVRGIMGRCQVMRLLMQGEAERADEAATELLLFCEAEHSNMEYRPNVLTFQSAAQLAMGNAAAARRLAEQAIALARTQGTRVFEARAQVALADALATADLEQNFETLNRWAQTLDEAERLVTQTGAESLSCRILQLRSRLATARGDESQAFAQLEQARKAGLAAGAFGHLNRLQAVTG